MVNYRFLQDNQVLPMRVTIPGAGTFTSSGIGNADHMPVEKGDILRSIKERSRSRWASFFGILTADMFSPLMFALDQQQEIEVSLHISPRRGIVTTNTLGTNLWSFFPCEVDGERVLLWDIRGCHIWVWGPSEGDWNPGPPLIERESSLVFEDDSEKSLVDWHVTRNISPPFCRGTFRCDGGSGPGLPILLSDWKRYRALKMKCCGLDIVCNLHAAEFTSIARNERDPIVVTLQKFGLTWTRNDEKARHELRNGPQVLDSGGIEW
jgi:hypothetical protein